MHQCPSIPENKGQVIYYCTNHVGVFFPTEIIIVHDIFPLNYVFCAYFSKTNVVTIGLGLGLGC